MKEIFYLLSFFFIASCVQSKNKPNNTSNGNEKQELIIENTKWEWKLEDNCINYLKFEEGGSYIEFNCELGEKWKGEYKIKEDTLLLINKIYTSDVPGEGEYVQNEYKMILTSKGLHVVYSRVFDDGSWNENWIKEPVVFYKKAE